MTVVPRWEWRIFGDDFGPAERRLAESSAARVEESDEVYVVSAASDASVKLRNGLLDIKERLAVDDGGLEQWKPVLKTRLSLGADHLSQVFDALALTDVCVLHVHKRRTHYEIGGCMAEITELKMDGAATRTIAVEAEDPALVTAAVHDLGLDGRPVVCMARGLKALVGLA